MDPPELTDSEKHAEFDKLDTDNDGELNVEDLKKMFYYESREDAKRNAAWRMKENGDTDGYLNFDGFLEMLKMNSHNSWVLTLWYNMQRITEEKRLELRIRFDMLDANHTGKLSANELVRMVQYSFLRLDERIFAARDDIKEFSNTEDEYLNFDDFVVLIAQQYLYLLGRTDSEVCKLLDA